MTTVDHSVEGQTSRAGTVDTRVIVGAIALATFIVHVIAASRMRTPIIQYADEAGYLGNARYIAQGFGRTGAGYASGYSLFLVPAAFVAHNPLTAYHLSLATNALLAATVPVLGYALVRRALPNAGNFAHIIAALLLVLYPGWFTFSNLAFSENALVPTMLAAAWVLAGAARSTPRWCVAGALCAYTYWISPRGVLVVLAFVFCCLVERPPWKQRSPAVPAIVTALLVSGIGRVVNVAIAGTTRVPGIDSTAGRLNPLRPLVHPGLWNDAATNFFGWLSYVATATLGLALIGVIVLTRAALRRSDPSSPLRNVASFAVPTLAATLVVGALGEVHLVVTRFDYQMYGRYLDGVIAPVLAVGAAATFAHAHAHALSRRRELNLALVLGAGAVGAALLFIALRPKSQPDATLNTVNVLGLRLYIAQMNGSIPRLLLIGAFVMAAVLLITAWSRTTGAVLMVVLFAWSSWLAYDHYAVPGSVDRAKQRVLVDAIKRLHDDDDVDTSCVALDDPDALSKWHISNYQFFVPHSEFKAADNDATCGPLVLSTRSDVPTRFPGARPVSFENYVPIGLWVTTSALAPAKKDALDKSGLLGPVPLGAPLPDGAYQSQIAVTPRVTGPTLHLTGGITHPPGGAPWPGSFSAVMPKGVGVVRAIATVVDANGAVKASTRCPLSRTLLPGESVNLVCDVPIGPLAPGRYEARVALVDEGIARFPDKEDTTVSVPFTR
jgi:hypothetical protein